MAYLPILGNAGTVVISVYENNTLSFTSTINISKFEEEYIESSGNRILYDEDDNAIKHFVGFKKNIKFSVYNSYTEDNYGNMVQLLYSLDSIKLNSETIKVTINYRANSSFGTITDAVFVKLPQINNVSQSSNVAEEFVFEIEERNPVTELLFGQVTGSGYLLLESGAYLLLESGGKINLEQDKYL